MLPLAIIVGAFALAAFMFYIAYSLQEEQQIFKFLYFALGMFLLVFAAYQLALLPMVPVSQLSEVVEDSQVWDGYCEVTDLFPSRNDFYAADVSCMDCQNTVGIVNNTWVKDGVYWATEENGAGFNATFNFTIETLSCLDHLHWTGRYDGRRNTGLKYYVYNWSSGAYVPLTSNYMDVLRSGTDSNYIVSGCHEDYLNDTTGEVHFRFAGVNVHGGDAMYFDYLKMDNEAPGYSVSTQIVNCSRDNVTKTYVYGNYSSGYEEFGRSMDGVATVLMWLTILILVVFLLRVLISVVRSIGERKKMDLGDGDGYDRPY